jgi:hypothetical protein
MRGLSRPIAHSDFDLESAADFPTHMSVSIAAADNATAEPLASARRAPGSTLFYAPAPAAGSTGSRWKDGAMASTPLVVENLSQTPSIEAGEFAFGSARSTGAGSVGGGSAAPAQLSGRGEHRERETSTGSPPVMGIAGVGIRKARAGAPLQQRAGEGGERGRGHGALHRQPGV